MFPTKAPDRATDRTVLVSVMKGTSNFDGEDKQVLIVETFGKPTMMIEESGNARLVRHDARGSNIGTKQVYASTRKFHCATPFTQPLSVIVGVYEDALKTIE